jgi:TonB family protein
MPPTAKELDVITPVPETSAAGRPQPVALEVPVSVNGARTVAGSDKREPFSEASVTVLVFANGAVIRLASAVVPGQLLFLTNEKTKKEVVCQVVKSKNYSNVSGYVELEFTEVVTGFWGMRFPGERGPAQPGAPSTPMAPPAAVTKVPPPAVTSAPKPVASKPAPPPPVVMKPAEISAPQANAQVNLPRAAETKPVTTLPKPVAPPSPLGTTTTSLPRASEIKLPTPAVPQAPPSASTSSPSSTDALKRESARLQEQLSSLLFTPEAPTQAAPPAPTKTLPPAKSAPLKMESTLDVEEVKIPSWLEPLARNAAATVPEPAAEDEPLKIDIDKAQEFELADLTAASIAQQTGTAVPAESPVGLPSLSEDAFEPKPVSAGSNKGILIAAVAAGLVLLAAGGAWVLRRPSNPVAQGAVIAETTPVAPAVTASKAPPPQLQSQHSAAVPTAPAAAPVISQPSTSSQASLQPAAQPVKTSNANNTETLLAYKQLGEPKLPPKKPSLGQVHLATPNVNRGASSRGGGDAEPALALSENQVSANSDAIGGGLVTGNAKQPAAPASPLPVGGDVKPARLLSSISPSYPALAKSQHIEGDVRVDALIDANGHVSAMKVISGPTLLHQAAMDALRQWKYQPAMLDGKAVPMHLTVTLQFRLR